MGDVVIILIVAAGLVFGLRATIRHMKGQGGGGCCGSVPKAAKKTLRERQWRKGILGLVALRLSQVNGAGEWMEFKESMDRIREVE